MADVTAKFTLGNNNLNAKFDLSEENRVDAIFKIDAAGTVWGTIDGTLSNQTDLQAALDLKVDKTELDADIAEVNSTISDLESVVNNNYTTLDNKIDEIESDLSGDISALSQTVEDNNTAVNNRIDETNDTVSNLSDTVTSNYNTLDGRINDEISNRTFADTTLQNNIDAEALARQNADTTLQGNIDTLSGTVTSNYNTLDGKITTNSDNITSLQNTINTYGDIVTYDAADFATSAQGALADTALQPNDNISELVNDVGYITSASLPTDYVPETRTINGYALSSNITLNYTDVGALSASTTINDLTTAAQQNALNSGATTTNIGQITTNANNISDIQDLIPNQASSSNQLADKSFVNSSIATNTANFIGTFNSVAELEAYTGTLTNNDYAFVATTDTAGNTLYDRYKYNADTQEWLFEYELNNSSFTAQQWASINSGITSGDVTLIGTALQPNDNISELTNDAGYITAASLPTVNNGTLTIQANGITVGTFTANQAGNTTANIVVPDSATWGNITGTLSNQTDLQNVLNTKQDVLTSENAGNCIEITRSSHSGLPAEYQELEYLQSSGTQYIDTGVYGTDKTSVQVKYSCIANTGGGGAGIIGFQTGFQTSPTFQRLIWAGQNNNQFRHGNLVEDTNTGVNLNTIYEETFGNGSWIINGESILLSATNPFTTSPNTMYLFALRTLNTIMSKAKIKLYYCSIKENDTLIRNFIPARRKSDGILGLYDLVNDEFLTNSGTGTFIAGRSVEEATKISFVNDANYITGITSSDVTTALGYTPYNSTNPNGYINASALNGYATESWVVNQNYVNNTTLATTLADYQPLLVSGTNIKTINNNSILGSGDLALDGLPSQTGQSGKFLTTDGTDASWATVTIPTPTYDSVNERITW